MESNLVFVTSRDGSVVGAERVGSGPPLVVIHGGTADRTRWAPVRDLLAEHFTAYLLDRRGRGASLSEATGPYSITREVEDVLAFIDDIGEPCYLLGHSYGALVGLEVLAATDRVLRAFLYEPPYDSGGYEVVPQAFRSEYARLIAAEQTDEALDLFYRDVLAVDPEPLHPLPIWQARKAAAHTMVREGDVVASYEPDATTLGRVATPTAILTGTASPPVFGAAARQAAEAIRTARLVEANGYGHTMIDANPDGFVGLVTDFLLKPA